MRRHQHVTWDCCETAPILVITLKTETMPLGGISSHVNQRWHFYDLLAKVLRMRVASDEALQLTLSRTSLQVRLAVKVTHASSFNSLHLGSFFLLCFQKCKMIRWNLQKITLIYIIIRHTAALILVTNTLCFLLMLHNKSQPMDPQFLTCSSGKCLVCINFWYICWAVKSEPRGWQLDENSKQYLNLLCIIIE